MNHENPKEYTGIVEGVVIDNDTQLPLAGVKVSIGSAVDTTSQDGIFILPDVPIGEQTIEAYLHNYSTYSTQIEVIDGIIQHNISIKYIPVDINWIQTALDSVKVYSFAVDQNDDIFAATDEGVFISTDNGDGWSQTRLQSKISNISINTNGIIYAASSHKLFSLTNDGGTYEIMVTLPDSIYITSMALNTNGIIFFATSELVWDEWPGVYTSKIFRSVDEGDNWENIFEYGYWKIYPMAINSNGDIFFGTYLDGEIDINRSTDNGITWTQIYDSYGKLSAIIFNENNDVFVGGTGSNSLLLYSTNNGNYWTRIRTGIMSPEIPALAINDRGHLFASSTGWGGNGVYRLTNISENWELINNGLGYPQVNTLIVDSGGYIFAGTNGKGVFRSINPTY